MSAVFKAALQYGSAGESAIAQWLRRRGLTVLPAYEKIINSGKGPRLFLPEGLLIAPDLLVFDARRVLWVEAKHKTAFSWHRLTQRWVTGIDLHHYEHYLRVDQESPWPVWLMFLHEGGQAKDSPPNSPSGLFANSIRVLAECENHRHDAWGNGGMVYWAHDKLILLAPLAEVMNGARCPSKTGAMPAGDSCPAIA